jgi:hypothetical protein
LGKQGIPELNHPPYCSDLPHTDVYLFLNIKFMLKGRRFGDTGEIKRNVTKVVLALHANEFKKCFQKLCGRAQYCVTPQGDNFEDY